MALSQHVWSRVSANALTEGGTTVSWYMDTRFNDPGPWSFQLQWAAHPDDEFVNVGAPTASFFAVDSNQRHWAKQLNSVYRVVLVADSGNVYTSPQISALEGWSYRDFRIAREIVRKEYLLLRKFTSARGLLFSQKMWGETCDVCVDPTTGETMDGKCLTCFGTRIVGGFYAPSTLRISLDNPPNDKIARSENRGTVHDMVRMGRFVAIPEITARDFWVDLDDDRRYRIQSRRTVAAIRGRPIVQVAELRLAPATDIIYQLPQDWDGGVAASSSSSV